MSDSYTEFGPLRYDQQEIAARGYGMAYSGSNNAIVCFKRQAVINPYRSKTEGKPVYEDKIMFTHMHPGETLTKVEHEARDDEKRRYPREWQAFVNGDQPRPDGIPLSLLFTNNPSIERTLIGYNIHTVEQLAHLSASAIQTVGMGCQQWVNQAVKYLEQAEKGVNIHRFEQESAQKDQRIATLERQVNELSQKLMQVLQPAQAQPPEGFDIQQAQLEARTFERAQASSLPGSVEFHSSIQTPDLSGEVRQRRPRSDRGKPRGPRKET